MIPILQLSQLIYSRTSDRNKLTVEVGAEVDDKSIRKTLRRLSGALSRDLIERIQRAIKSTNVGDVLVKEVEEIFDEAAKGTNKKMGELAASVRKVFERQMEDARQAIQRTTLQILKSSQIISEKLGKLPTDIAKTISIPKIDISNIQKAKATLANFADVQNKVTQAVKTYTKTQATSNTTTNQAINKTEKYKDELIKAEVRIKAAGASNSKFQKILKRVNNELTRKRGLPQGTKNIEAINIAAKQATSSFGKWAKAGTRVLIAMGLLGTVRRITQDVTDLARGIGNLALKAAELRDAEVGFRRLASQTTNATLALTRIRQAAAGTVDDFTLLQSATTAALAGLDISKFDEIVVGARALAAVTGRDVPDAIQRLTNAITKQERRLLDELGIIVRAEDLFKDYAKTQGLVASQLTASEKAAAFFDGVLKKVNEKVEILGGVIEEAQGPFLRFEESVRNVGLAIGESIRQMPLFKDTLSGLTGIINQVAGAFENAETKAAKLFIDSKDKLEEAKKLAKSGNLPEFLLFTGESLRERAIADAFLSKQLEKSKKKLDDLRKASALLTQEFEKADPTLGELVIRLQTLDTADLALGRSTSGVTDSTKKLNITSATALLLAQELRQEYKATEERLKGLTSQLAEVRGEQEEINKGRGFQFLTLNKQQLERTLKEQLATIDFFAAKQKKSESDRIKERIQELKDFEELAVQFKVEGFDKTVQLLQEQHRLELALQKEKEARERKHTKFINDEQTRRQSFIRGINRFELKGIEDKFQKQRETVKRTAIDLGKIANKNITDEKLREKELSAIRNQLAQNLLKIDRDEADEKAKISKQLADKLRKQGVVDAKKEVSRVQQFEKGITSFAIKAETDRFEKRREQARKFARDLAERTKADSAERGRILAEFRKVIAAIDAEEEDDREKKAKQRADKELKAIEVLNNAKLRAEQKAQRIVGRILQKGQVNQFDRRREALKFEGNLLAQEAIKRGFAITKAEQQVFIDANKQIGKDELAFRKKISVRISKDRLSLEKTSSRKFRELREQLLKDELDLVKAQVKQGVLTIQEGELQKLIIIKRFNQDIKKSLVDQIRSYADAATKITDVLRTLGIATNKTAEEFKVAIAGIVQLTEGLFTGNIPSVITGIEKLGKSITDLTTKGIRGDIKRLDDYKKALEQVRQKTIETGRTIGQSLGAAITDGLEVDFDVLVQQFVKANIAKSIADVAVKKLGPLLREMEQGIAARFLGPEDFNKQFEAELNARVATFKAASKGDFDKFVRDTFIDPTIIAEAQLKGVNEDNKFRIVASRLLQQEGVKENLNKVHQKLLDQVNDLTPGLRAITNTLGKAFGGITDANSRLDEAIPQVSFRAATEPQFDSHLLMMSQLLNFQSQISTNTGSIAGSTSEMANILRNQGGIQNNNFVPGVGGINQGMGLEGMNNVNNLNDAVLQGRGLQKQGIGGNVLIAQ